MSILTETPIDPAKLMRLPSGALTGPSDNLLEIYRNYLSLLARVQIGRGCKARSMRPTPCRRDLPQGPS